MRPIRLRTAIIASLTLLLAACVPEFENPVIGGPGADPAVLGAWDASRSDEPDEKATVTITEQGDGLLIVISEIDPDARVREQRFTAISGRAGDRTYLNVKSLQDNMAPQDAFILLRYTAMGDRIEVQSLSEAKIEAAIADGLLTGTITHQGIDSTPRITSSAAEVATFLASPRGREAFRPAEDGLLILTRKTP
jgi:hypothetical protein